MIDNLHTLNEAGTPESPQAVSFNRFVLSSGGLSADTSIRSTEEGNNNFCFGEGKKFNLILGDAIAKMQEIETGSIDLVVTSPPYNKAGFEGFIRKRHSRDSWNGGRNIEYGEDAENDFMPDEEYQQWQIKVLNEIHRILKVGGSCCYNHKIRVRDYVASFPTEWICKSELKVRQEITWDRGSTPAVNNIRFYPTTEKIYWLFKGDKPKYFNGDMAIYKEVWRLNPDSGNEHPAPFPIELSDRCVVALSQENETVLDCFMGSGTVGQSCMKHKRNFIGIELNEKYYKLAKGRISAEQNQIKLF